jgi:NADH-quinone oxidoreductase subunit M
MAERDVIWMSLVTFLPTAFALVLLLFPRGTEEWMRRWSLAGTLLTLGVSLGMFLTFYGDTLERHGVLTNAENREKASLEWRAAQLDKASASDPQQVGSPNWLARYPWIPRFNIDYFLGADGISVSLVLLTTVLSALAMLASWKIDRFVKGYCILFLLLETGMLGTFFALDFFLFYIFWEMMLLPMYFLIGIWGGPRREYAAIKFFLYTLFGSVFILIALLAFYFTDVRDFVSERRVEEAATRLRSDRPGLSIAQAREQAEVHTFDIVLLARVGRGAQQYLRDRPDNPVPFTAVPRVEDAYRAVLDAQKDVARLTQIGAKPAEVEAARAKVRAAEEKLKTTDQEVKKEVKPRLAKMAFFQPWFQYTMFLFLFVGFAIKVPVFPFHTWLPDAHVEAPTPISMILAGVLLKMGGYGIIRIAYPICPWAAEMLSTLIVVFAMINIVYGAFAAMAQTDFKKLVAYSSISHMGYVILGIAVWSAHNQYWDWGMNGAMFQMLAHGISSAGMFFLVGVIYDRAHHRNLDNFRGLMEPMPLYGGVSAVIFFAAMGLPGLCGFVGEFMVVLATWNYQPGGPVFAFLAALTVVLTAAYILWTLQRVFLGTNPQYKNYTDMTVAEFVCSGVLVVLAVALGVWPGLVLTWMEPSVTALVDTLAILKP